MRSTIRSRARALGLSFGVLACAALALPALGQAAEVQAMPSSLSFAPTMVGAESASQVVTFTNGGTQTIAIEGSFLADEGIREFPYSSDCGGEFRPGESCEIEVSFAPLRKGARSAELELVLVLTE